MDIFRKDFISYKPWLKIEFSILTEISSLGLPLPPYTCIELVYSKSIE